MSQAILKNNEKLYLIKVNDKTYCSVGYTPGDALSTITLPADGLVTVEIQEEHLFVSNTVCKNRTSSTTDFRDRCAREQVSNSASDSNP